MLPILLALLPAVCPAGVEVRPASQGRLDVTVQGVALAEALDCVGRRARLKVVYDGLPAPRQLVTASLKGATIAEVVDKLLEGRGLNYALGVEPQGGGGGLLVISASSPAGEGSRRPVSAPAPEPPVDYPVETELVADAELAVDPDAQAAGPAASAPGTAGAPGGVAPPGGPDPMFRPLYPAPGGLTPATLSPFLYPAPVVLTPTTR